MTNRIRALATSLAVTALGLMGFAGPALACSTYGRTFDDVAQTSTLIVEADVTGIVSGGGYRLQAREIFAGSMPAGGVVGTVPSLPGSECTALVDLDPGDHVVLGFMDPTTALGAETVVWWVEADGTIERTSIVEDTDTTTIAAVREALRARLPDTSMTASIHAPPPDAPGSWPVVPLGFVFGVAFAVRIWPRNNGLPKSA